MCKTIWKFGLLSGVVAAVIMGIYMPISVKLNHEGLAWVLGYTGIVLSFLVVYFGVRSYRDNICGGQISFGRAFGVGMCMVLISSAFYVVTWEIVYFNFLHGFMDNYGSHVIEKLKSSAASAAVIQAKTAEWQRSRALYENPLYNAAITFLEPFPAGLLMTLISAAVLRKKPAAAMAVGMTAS